ncbi:MAG: prolipoprotein diacylglyceryl transferase [Cyclobacteriaceae bacterium]|nr:prolipoprotein diacylglyceryl transferase [Cyclobacteriaceae bacterium]MBX2957726.1 prolipoprotein diacylglyceryl transferase [Cyclobacteriaceae bacterium]
MAQWIEKLKSRWNLKSTGQVVLVLIVFACTGTTVLLIKRPLFAYWFPDGEKPVWATITYFILILPVYNVFLLFYGFVFGQFRFFWDFEKRFFSRIFSTRDNRKNKPNSL